MHNNLYKPANSIQIINKVKDSKFYGSIAAIEDKNEAEKFIDKIKNKFYDASHNVNAYKIGYGDRALKYADDDGEPAGSSGPPVLQTIEGEDLINTVIVVTRYFGGTKLGIGGLIRAYGDTARIVIREAGKNKLKPVFKLMIKGNYEQIGTILGQVEAATGKIVSTDYTNEGCKVYLLLRPEKFNSLKKNLIEKTGNRVEINKIKEMYL